MHELRVGNTLVYRGEHDPNDVFCTVRWHVEDLICAMDDKDIELTDENIDRAIQAVNYLHDGSVEYGWEAISTLLDFNF